MTLNLKVDLGVAVEKGQAAVSPMTVVYAPTRNNSTPRSTSYFGSTVTRAGEQEPSIEAGSRPETTSTVPEFKFRDFILKTSKRNFLLVFPTLGDKSRAGLLNRQDQAEAFLQQVLNGVRAK